APRSVRRAAWGHGVRPRPAPIPARVPPVLYPGCIGSASRARLPSDPQPPILPGMRQDHSSDLVAIVRRVRHDANNPLTAALGNVQLALGEETLEEAEVRRTLRVVETELLKLAEILRGLDAVREAGLQPTAPAPSRSAENRRDAPP